MKNKKIIIILMIIFIIICIVAISLIIYINKKKYIGSDYQDTEFERDISHEVIKTSTNKVTDRNNFYAVKKIIGNYVSNIIEQNIESDDTFEEGLDEEYIQEIKEYKKNENNKVYLQLNPEYISSNNITKENVNDYVEKLLLDNISQEEIEENLNINIYINEMYYKQNSINTTTYLAIGTFVNSINSEEIPFKILVDLDSKNNVYYITPTKYFENTDENSEEILEQYNSPNEIEKNEENTFKFANVDDFTVIEDYIYDFKKNLYKDIDKSYELLDKEYREKRFDNIEEYKEYVKENIKSLLSISAESYAKDKKDDYTEYLILDNNDNYYIIKETAIMDYTILLDTYNVKTQDFIDKYKKEEGQTKAGMQVQKVIQALNLKDYKYIYNHLNENFKQNKFGSFEKFKEYMKYKYPDTYKVSYSTGSKQGDTYIQPITLESTKGEKIDNKIIIQLKEDLEFVMSFNVED